MSAQIAIALALAAGASNPIPSSAPQERVEVVALASATGGEESVPESVELDYLADAAGFVFVRASSETVAVALELRGPDGAQLASAEGGGPRRGVGLRQEVRAGASYALTLRAKEGAGDVRVELVPAPESATTLAAAARARDRIAAALELSAENDPEAGGATEAARAEIADALDELLAVEGAAESPAVGAVLTELAFAARSVGDLRASASAFEAALAHAERTLAEDDPDLLGARNNVAAALWSVGETERARALFDQVLEARQRTLAPDDPDLLTSLGNAAAVAWTFGDLLRAQELQQRVLEALERTLPPEDLRVLMARGNLGLTLYTRGDIAGAHALQARVLDDARRGLPPEHPYLLDAKRNLAATMRVMGDRVGARALEEQVLAVLERTLPEDHPDLQRIRANLAVTLRELGDLDGARALIEKVVAARERTLPEDAPERLKSEQNLASTLDALGEHERARALEEHVLAVRERTLPEGHLDLISIRQNLAATLAELGDLAGARALGERALASLERGFPPDHPELLLARNDLAMTVLEAGDLEAAHALFETQVAGLMRGALSALRSGPRQAGERLAADSKRVATALLLADPGSERDRRALFELVETRRLVVESSLAAARAAAADPELAELASAAAEARSRLNDLVAGGARAGLDAAAFARELAAASGERDSAEDTIARALSRRGLNGTGIDAGRLAAALPPHAAAVGYLRTRRWERDADSGKVRAGPDHLLAHVLRADGALARVELGPAGELEQMVLDWRAAVGSPLSARGVVPEPARTGRGDPTSLGRALREHLLDPLLAAAGEGVDELFVCPDDLVLLVPLDALPSGEGVVGDRVAVRVQSSFARLALGSAGPVGSAGSAETGGFVGLGGADYEAQAEAPGPLLAMADAAPAATLRGTGSGSFPPLPAAAEEVAALGALYERTHDDAPVILAGAAASKPALRGAVVGARWLHLATHGWFAPESLHSIADGSEGSGSSSSRLDLEEQVRGFAPLTLCGLALAGANRPPDDLGRVPGLLTAEELASFDLSSCELAVLSACETNVGLRRAGQGIQSLQTALHAAGARSAITSLWKVDDEATRELFERFYRYLWSDRLSVTEALWRAKSDLRGQGRPQRDWAEWVLSGDPH